ncbi:MAG TPA: hypothetical protein VEG35_05395 [Burkholderiales bacterium]|nr:hypothetical protein [Burkholderiales bacterium]
MNTKAKLVIFLVAVMISLIGFNLIASPSAVSLAKAGQLNGYRVDVIASTKLGPSAPAVVHINGLP